MEKSGRNRPKPWRTVPVGPSGEAVPGRCDRTSMNLGRVGAWRLRAQAINPSKFTRSGDWRDIAMSTDPYSTGESLTAGICTPVLRAPIRYIEHPHIPSRA